MPVIGTGESNAVVVVSPVCISVVLLFAVGSIGAVGTFPLPMNHTEQDTRAEQMRELVSKYCRLDYEGARLDPQAWAKLQPLVWWKANPDYTQINVISRYTVETAPVLTHGKYTVTVHYRLLGRFEPGIGYSRRARELQRGRGIHRHRS